MLQFPTNVYPQNIAIDPSWSDDKGNRLSFVFNGDILSSVTYRVYDYTTKQPVYTAYYANNRRVLKYNGQQLVLNSSPFGSLQSNKDYVMQMLLTQSYADGSDNIYDMAVVRGVIQTASGTSIHIAKNIPNIYEWNVSSSGMCRPTIYSDIVYAGMVLKVGAESKFIKSYNRKTGELILSEAFSSNISGSSYQILSNYLITPQYYFMLRDEPTVTQTITTSPYSGDTACTIACSADYVSSDMIKYYTYRLFWTNIDVHTLPYPDYRRTIRESPKIYSQEVKWYFTNPFVGIDTISGGDLGTIYYWVQLEIVTQNDMVITSNERLAIAPETTTELFVSGDLNIRTVNSNKPDYIENTPLETHQAIEISTEWIGTDNSYYNPNYEAEFYRRDLETNIVTKIKNYYTRSIVVDYAVPNKGKFEYTVVPRGETNGVPYTASIKTKTVEVDMAGYSITELITQNAHADTDDIRFKVGRCWKFIGEIDDTTITQNINRSVQTGHGRYTCASSGITNYASGTLSVALAYVSCPDGEYMDTVNMVKSWREFITQDTVFLLKSHKGDVWIVNITDSPTTGYEESICDVPTKISFSWSECMSLDNVEFIQRV